MNLEAHSILPVNFDDVVDGFISQRRGGESDLVINLTELKLLAQTDDLNALREKYYPNLNNEDFQALLADLGKRLPGWQTEDYQALWDVVGVTDECN